MSELRDWLRQHNLEQYADAFEANDIGLDILSELTERDFEQLGVSLGNRRRLMRAITERGSEPAPQAADNGTATDAERRQVTVLFCDMVGSTALSGAVDPELLGSLIRRYQDATAGAIGRYGGFVAKFMGDGVLAYFGFPRAYEDAAERAVRAALGILAEIGVIARPDGSPLQARVGIATGLVVVGEIVGTGSAQERTIVGETPNLAARLQALAAPDTILISETTQSLLRGRFDLEVTGTHELKGFARPVPVWRVLGETAAESRFAAVGTGAAAPLVGRAHEMGLLLDRWRLARSGEGQCVTLIGEAGIGKSRSVEALQDTISGEPHVRVHLQGSPYHSDTALYPVIQHISRAARFAPGDPAEARIEKLGTLFARRAQTDATAVPLLAELMSMPLADQAAISVMTPAQRKAATLALLVDEIVRFGEREPVLLILEDAQWVDVTTLDMMTGISDSIGQARLLVIVTGRPDFSPPWLTRPHATMLTLGRLSRAECAELVAVIAAAHGLSAETVATIVSKTDGVPLFAEELTKSVMEAAGADGAAVPATLKDSLTARLDRLADAREVAQAAAVIGRQFSFPLLEAIAPRRGPELEAALAKVVAAGIVFPEGRGAERSFAFKHALMRDAAYESLLLARRRDWHARVARAVEERFPELAANEPELLAYHFAEAGLIESACDYRMRAGDRAANQSAYREAMAHFSTGLKLADALPDSAARMRRQLDFLLKLGPAMMPVYGMQSTEVEDVYSRASEISERLDDGVGSYKAKWGLWLSANLRRKTALARERARELVTLAQRFHDSDLLLEAYHCRWSTAFFRGEVAASLADSRIGIDSYDMHRHRRLSEAFGGHDPGVCAYCIHASALEQFAKPSEAAEAFAKGIALAETLDHPNTIAFALINWGQTRRIVNDREAVFAAARRAALLAEKFQLPVWRPGSVLLMAWANAVGSGVADSARVVDAELDRAMALAPMPQYYLGLAADVCLAAGRPVDAMAHLDRALAALDEPGVGFYLPEIHRLRGECLLALDRNNRNEAQQAFVIAGVIARQQGTIVCEQRAEASLAKLIG